MAPPLRCFCSLHGSVVDSLLFFCSLSVAFALRKQIIKKVWEASHYSSSTVINVPLEYKRRQELWLFDGVARNSGPVPILNGPTLSRSLCSSSGSEEACLVEFVAPFQIEDVDNTSIAKHLEYANTMFSFIWWIIGFYWVSSGGTALLDDTPYLYWLCITFLAFDVFFVVTCVVVACLISIVACCCS